jgi:signal transduction histidine kinase
MLNELGLLDQHKHTSPDEGVVTSPTELNRLKEELAQAYEALARTDTMKSRFINIAAHELRTPLAAVYGYVSLLTAPGSEFMECADEKTLKIIEGVTTGIDRLRGLVQDMLDVTRLEAGSLQLSHSPVSIQIIFNSIAKDFQGVIAKRHQTLMIANARAIPFIWADGERVIQILRNLLSNAVKYTPDGGQITVSAEIVSYDGHFPSTDLATDPDAAKFIQITVSDTGVGIPLAQQERIFESFHEVRDIELHSTSKTDFMGGGAGLGLPIARGVAKAHGGALWAESDGYDPDKCPGSKFHLILPFRQQ